MPISFSCWRRGRANIADNSKFRLFLLLFSVLRKQISVLLRKTHERPITLSPSNRRGCTQRCLSCSLHTNLRKVSALTRKLTSGRMVCGDVATAVNNLTESAKCHPFKWLKINFFLNQLFDNSTAIALRWFYQTQIWLNVPFS